MYYGWATLIIVLMVLPISGGTPNWMGHLDSLVHFALFGIAGGLIQPLLDSKRSSPESIILLSSLLSLTVGAELIQLFISYRYFSRIDLLFNTLGTGWGVFLARHAYSKLYLSVSSILLGLTFGLIQFDEILFFLLFKDYGLSMLWAAVLLPIFAFLAPFKDRNGFSLIWMGAIYGLFMVTANDSSVGIGLLLGSLSLTLFLYITYHSIAGSSLGAATTNLAGLTGVILFLLKAQIGTSTFVINFGMILPGGLLLASVVQILLLTRLKTVSLKRQFPGASDTTPSL
jgi:VanZ family protein